MSVACEGTARISPTLILLGIRLGIDHVTPVYWDGLKAALQYPQSVGIAGYLLFYLKTQTQKLMIDMQQRSTVSIPLLRWSPRLSLFLP